MLGAKLPQRGVRTVVEYIHSLKMAREKQYARLVYHALMRDWVLPEVPSRMAWRRAMDIRLAVASRLPERRAEPRADPMCHYPLHCSGTCIYQQESGWACNS